MSQTPVYAMKLPTPFQLIGQIVCTVLRTHVYLLCYKLFGTWYFFNNGYIKFTICGKMRALLGQEECYTYFVKDCLHCILRILEHPVENFLKSLSEASVSRSFSVNINLYQASCSQLL